MLLATHSLLVITHHDVFLLVDVEDANQFATFSLLLHKLGNMFSDGNVKRSLFPF